MGNSSEGTVVKQVRVNRDLYTYHHDADHVLFGRCRSFLCQERNHWLSSKILKFANRDETSLVLQRLCDSIAEPEPDLLRIWYAAPTAEEDSCSSVESKLIVWFEPSDSNLESRVLECINLCEPFT